MVQFKNLHHPWNLFIPLKVLYSGTIFFGGGEILQEIYVTLWNAFKHSEDC